MSNLTETEAILRPTISSGIAVLGTLSNALSLSYFISSSSHEKRDLDLLLTVLNVFDLIVCVSAAGMSMVYQINTRVYGYENNVLTYFQNFFLDIFTASIQCAGFVTCILSVTRFVCFWNPFYKLRVRLIKLSIAIYVAIMVLSSIVFTSFWYCETYQPLTLIKITMWMDLANLIIIILLVSVFNSITLVLLTWKSNRAPDAIFKDAAVTVLIISSLFCLFHIFYVTRTAACLFKNDCDPESVLDWLFCWVALPLNSTLNPLIYFMRAENMRAYVGNLFCRIRIYNTLSVTRSTRSFRDTYT